VNAEQIRDWTLEAIMYERFIETAKTTEASARELRIQNSKFRRLLAKQTPGQYQLAAGALGGGPSKKERKRRGQAAAQIGEQRKKVRKLLTQFMKEFVAIRVEKKPRREVVRAAMSGLDKAIAQIAQKLITDTSKIAAKLGNS
jgi:hypothetical protein